MSSNVRDHPFHGITTDIDKFLITISGAAADTDHGFIKLPCRVVKSHRIYLNVTCPALNSCSLLLQWGYTEEGNIYQTDWVLSITNSTENYEVLSVDSLRPPWLHLRTENKTGTGDIVVNKVVLMGELL